MFNRKMMAYKRAFELTRLIISNYSPDISKERENRIALLFDMNELWEEYVFVQLRQETLKPDSKYKGYTVSSQHSKSFWKGNLKFVKEVAEGRLCKNLGDKVLDGFLNILNPP